MLVRIVLSEVFRVTVLVPHGIEGLNFMSK